MSDVDIRMTRARSFLVKQHAFFGSLAMRLVIEERNDITTMATNGRFLFYCRDFLDRMSEEIILFTVAHEVLHCALGHHVRRKGRDPKRWNIACDYVVNWLLKLAGFKIPEWVYIDPKFAGMTVEDVFHILEQQDKQKEQQQQQKQQQMSDEDLGDEPPDDYNEDDYDSDQEGEDECTSNGAGDQDSSQSPAESSGEDGTSPTTQDENATAGEPGSSTDEESVGSGPQESADATSTQTFPESCGDPGGCGEVLDAAPEYDRAALSNAEDEWQVATRQAANIARRQGEGKLPGFIEEIVSALHTAQTDWRSELRQFVQPLTSTKDYTWMQPNRRYVAFGMYAPGVISDGVNHVGLVIDTSYSIASEWLQKFGGEVQAALDDGAIDKVTLIFADTRVIRTTEYQKGEIIDFTIPGRGGTAFSPSFTWLNENAPDVAVAIYFTDLDCTDFGPEPSYPVLWAVYGDDLRRMRQLEAAVPWGQCIELR